MATTAYESETTAPDEPSRASDGRDRRGLGEAALNRSVQQRRPAELTAQRLWPATLAAGAGLAAAGAWLDRRHTRTPNADAQQTAHP